MFNDTFYDISASLDSYGNISLELCSQSLCRVQLVMLLGVFFLSLSRNMWDRSLAVWPETVVTEIEARVQLGIDNSNFFQI